MSARRNLTLPLFKGIVSQEFLCLFLKRLHYNNNFFIFSREKFVSPEAAGKPDGKFVFLHLIIFFFLACFILSSLPLDWVYRTFSWEIDIINISPWWDLNIASLGSSELHCRVARSAICSSFGTRVYNKPCKSQVKECKEKARESQILAQDFCLWIDLQLYFQSELPVKDKCPRHLPAINWFFS